MTAFCSRGRGRVPGSVTEPRPSRESVLLYFSPPATDARKSPALNAPVNCHRIIETQYKMPSVDVRNPLLQVEFQIPFDQIRAEHVEPAVGELLSDARAQLEQLTSDTGPRTFSNTMEPLDALTERLDYAVGIARHLEAVATTPELRAAYNAVQPLVSAFYSSLPLNESLWQAVQNYSKTDEAQGLSGARKRF